MLPILVGLLAVTVAPALAADTSSTTSDTSTTSTSPTTSVPGPAGPSTSSTSSTATVPGPPGTTSAPPTSTPFATPAVDGPAPGEGTPQAGAQPGGDDGPNVNDPAVAGYLTGPDVSSWQHPGGAAINWGQVAAAGHSFAFVKATEGPSALGRAMYRNPWFEADFGGAAGAGLYRAPYHFARPMLPLSTAADQARYMISVTGLLNGPRDLPPVLDLEVTGGLDPQSLADWTVTFVQEIQRLTGRAPIIYTGPYFWRTAMADTTRLRDYPLWVASWTSASSPGALFGGWTSWAFWQYTDSGSAPGIPGSIDLNRFCCGYGGLAALAGHPVRIYNRLSNSDGVADGAVDFYVPPGGQPLSCDWNGDGIDTPGVFFLGTWFITNYLASGEAQIITGFGDGGDTPVCGDWDGNGTETPGVVRRGVWYLANSAVAPRANAVFGYGNYTDTPVVGDWNADGRDDVGVVRDGFWYLSRVLGSPRADTVTGFGDPGDIPIVGDWNNDGIDTPGVVRRGWWYQVDSLGPFADRVFQYGDAGDTPLTGRWYWGLPTTVAVARQG